jgi:hypothetical protein
MSVNKNILLLIIEFINSSYQNNIISYRIDPDLTVIDKNLYGISFKVIPNRYNLIIYDYKYLDNQYGNRIYSLKHDYLLVKEDLSIENKNGYDKKLTESFFNWLKVKAYIRN